MLETFHHLVGQSSDSIAWWQMCIRAIVIFVWALILYRALPRRAFGSSAASDIVVVVIIGSSLSRALTGNAPLVPAVAATAALAICYSLINWLARRSELVSRAVKGRPVRLILDGHVDPGAMRRAELGERDLTENLRSNGVSRPEQVAEAYLERNGTVSVIRKG